MEGDGHSRFPPERGEISQCASVILGKDEKGRSELDQSGPWKSGDALEFNSV